MSFHLEQLLDPARRRECEANDAALQETTMKHGIRSASRAYVDLQARQPSPADSNFHITVFRPGQPEETYLETSPNGAEAYFKARDKYGPGVHIVVNDSSWLEQSIGRV